MMLPSGSEQLLSLAWALENIAAFTKEDAIKAICQVVGIERTQWEIYIEDRSWFVGDSRCNSREQIESKWNALFSKVTNTYLDEDSWHIPLWQLWLREPKMIFAENLTYLIKARGRGTVVRLAKFTRRNTTTASKWGHWRKEGRKVRLPPATLVPRILEFFDLKPSCDLYHEPLFLGRAEIHDVLLRIDGKYYLDCLSGEHLNQAVNRLREESARQATKKRL